SVRPGHARESLHPPGHHGGRPFGRGGRVALPHRFLAPLARPPRLCPLRHDPELGRGGGKKKQTGGLRPPSWIGAWATSPATWSSTRCMTAPSAWYVPRAAPGSAGFTTKASTTPPTTTTSAASYVNSGKRSPPATAPS